MIILKNRIIRLIILIFIATPVLAWFVIKPVRLIAPEWSGVHCDDVGVCVESQQDYDKAQKLRSQAIAFLASNLGTFSREPKVVFCSSWACARDFGLGERSAVSFASFGTAFSPRAWKPYYVRHELIHQLQVQELGVIRCFLLPSWLIEGMAYSLSEDPRRPLTQPWETYRSQFEEWLASTDVSRIWTEAKKQ